VSTLNAMSMERAQQLARKRLAVVQRLRSNPFVRADAYYQVGSLALRERQLDQAEGHLRRAWYEVQRVDFDAPSVARQRAETLYHRVVWALGVVFLYNRKTTHGHMLYEQARYLWDELAFEQPVPLQLPSDRDRVPALTDLGLSQRLQGRYPEAQRSLQQAWTLASETGQGNLHAISDELSRLALLTGDSEAAAAWLDQVADAPADPALWAARQLVRAKVALAGQRRAQARALIEQVQANADVPAPYRYQAQVLTIRAQLPGELAPVIDETTAPGSTAGSLCSGSLCDACFRRLDESLWSSTSHGRRRNTREL